MPLFTSSKAIGSRIHSGDSEKQVSIEKSPTGLITGQLGRCGESTLRDGSSVAASKHASKTGITFRMGKRGT